MTIGQNAQRDKRSPAGHKGPENCDKLPKNAKNI